MDRLRNEIIQGLGIKEHLVVINRLTGHIVIKVCKEWKRHIVANACRLMLLIGVVQRGNKKVPGATTVLIQLISHSL